MPEPWENPDEEIKDLLEGLQKRFKNGWLLQRGLVLVAFAGVFVVLGVLTSMYTVEPEEKAVIMRFGRYLATQGPGLHFKLPFGIDRHIKVPTERILQEEFGFRSSAAKGNRTQYEDQAFDEESLMLTGDLNVADVEWIVQYKIAEPQKYLFNTRDVRKNLRDVSLSVVRRVIGDRRVGEVLTTGRVAIAEEAQRLMQEVLDRYAMGVRIVTLKLQDVNPPESVRPAFNEVNAAKQEQEKVINQAEREYNKVIPEARGKADETVSKAEGEAERVVNTAKGDAARFENVLREYRKAPAITRTRLYLETLEDIYSRFSEITIVDKGVKGVLPVFDNPTPSAGGK
ncbi:MAG: FtsH protease activity modulator HflK [Elusimicrobia bacterium CG_4_9_14_3_um_filter_62_55]|nr:MAG: FtsH protease activity modulator HflK [Elusimicrobia bacterium CG22_combo_CG10-13_8_21_14_all_63_91]PJA14233.1 MAG: FtsH protease activity modulator HflK [Elusimicrobia bacterium CG_4_10_14_0_2_um_filter_63_34]PJB24612.1 MAG: FtsH protease activity modulator HflK [Elusimicrobia bacterium CG_4_9_14_3_um_filter_62_55]